MAVLISAYDDIGGADNPLGIDSIKHDIASAQGVIIDKQQKLIDTVLIAAIPAAAAQIEHQFTVGKILVSQGGK